MRAKVFTFLLLAGCGASGGAPAEAPPSAPAECTAGFGATPPAGWIEGGVTIQVTFKGGKPTAAEGHAADGKVSPVLLPGDGKEKDREALSQEVCRLGGLYGAVDPAAMKRDEGTVAVRVMKPAAPSEKADLALFCAGPPDPRLASGSFDPSQMRTLAMLTLREVLTTPRWRSWIVAQGRRVQAAEGPAKDKIYAEMVAELRAAGAPQSCWFAGAVLQR
jgi:hypothetical protein